MHDTGEGCGWESLYIRKESLFWWEMAKQHQKLISGNCHLHLLNMKWVNKINMYMFICIHFTHTCHHMFWKSTELLSWWHKILCSLRNPFTWMTPTLDELSDPWMSSLPEGRKLENELDSAARQFDFKIVWMMEIDYKRKFIFFSVMNYVSSNEATKNYIQYG